MDTNAETSPEETGAAALGWIAGDPDMLSRFIAITGIAPEHIREAAREPGFLAGVLDFILAHEPTLMAFSAEAHISPETIAKARNTLAGPEYGPGDFTG